MPLKRIPVRWYLTVGILSSCIFGTMTLNSLYPIRFLYYDFLSNDPERLAFYESCYLEGSYEHIKAGSSSGPSSLAIPISLHRALRLKNTLTAEYCRRLLESQDSDLVRIRRLIWAIYAVGRTEEISEVLRDRALWSKTDVRKLLLSNFDMVRMRGVPLQLEVIDGILSSGGGPDDDVLVEHVVPNIVEFPDFQYVRPSAESLGKNVGELRRLWQRHRLSVKWDHDLKRFVVR